MADTNTANLGLLIADLNDTFNFGAHVEANFTTIDGLMGAVQCTSGSRPTNTYAGQIIYETDSKRYVQNTGTKAVPVWTYMSHQAYATASAARPTVGLTAGELLYETDNFLLRTRGSGAWNGFLPVATSTGLPGNPLAGDFAYLSDKDCVVRYTGTLWKLTSTVVCTSSTRPTVGIAAGTSIYETDTTRLLIYNGTSWEQKAFGSFVCTSSTHPGSPFTGLEIFETDTGRSLVYNGTSYIPQGATLMADPINTSTSGTTATTTEVLDTVLGTYQFQAISGRRYMAFYTGLKGGGTAGDLYTVNLRDSGSASTPTNTSTVVASGTWYCKATGGGGQDSFGVITDIFVAGSTGTHTIGAFAIRNAGSGTFTPISGGTGRSIFVFDTGLT